MPVPGKKKWTRDIFAADQVQKGGIVRRSRRDVRKYGDFQLLKREVLKRGFHLIRTGEQYIVLCHKGELRIFC